MSQLILLVIVFQEQNAAPPPQLPTAAGQVDKTAKVLVDVAKSLADEEYSDYPDIRKEIIDAADDVNKSSNDLIAAVKFLQTAQDRKSAWDKLVEACKVISGKTILLLQIVYGAELKRIFAAAQATRDRLNALDTKKAHTDPQAFADAAGDVATRANQLAEYLKAKANDEDSPLLKQQLLDNAKELETGAENIINTVNKVLENPDDQAAINQFNKEKKDLEAAIVRATEPLKEQLAANQDARKAFDSKVRPAPAADTRAPRRPVETKPIDVHAHDKDREAREKARVNLPAHEKNALNSADRVRDDLGDIRDRAHRGEPDAVNHFAKQLDTDHAQFNKDARLAADKADDPARRKRMVDGLNEMDKVLPLVKATAGQLAAQPDSKAAKKNYEDANNKYEDALNAVTDAIDPGASLAAQAAQLARDVDKVRDDAKSADAPGVAVAANSAGRRAAHLQEAAKAIADATDDPMRKKAINAAAADLAKLLPRQIDSANRVLEAQTEPNRAELDGRTEQLKDVLQQLAAAANPSPQEQLAEAAARIKDGLAKVERGVHAGDNKQVEEGIKAVEAASKPFVRNAQGQSDSAINPTTRRQLQEAIAALQQPLSALPPDARKAAANNKDVQAMAKLADDIDKINANVDAVLKGTNAAAMAEAKKESDELTRLANSLKNKDMPDVAAAARQAAQHQAKLAELVPRAAADSDDQLRRKNMLSALDNLDRLLPQMLAASEQAVKHPDDKAAAAKLDADRKGMQLELARLVDALNPAVPAEASRGKRLEPDDPYGRKAALSALDHLERLIPQMQAAAQKLAQNPEDPEARKNLNKTFRDIDTPMASVVARFASPEDQLEAAVRTLEDDLNDLIQAANGNDTPAFVYAAQDIAARQKEIGDQVRAHAAKADDPIRRKRIENSLDALDHALPAVIAAAKEAHAKKGDPDVQKKLNRAAELYKGGVDALARSVKPTSEQRLLDNVNKLGRALAQLQEATARGDKAQAEQLLGVVGDLHDAVQRDGAYEAQHARDPKTRAAIDQLLKSLDDQVQRALPESTHRAVANPKDAGAMRAQDDSVKAINAALAKLVDATKAKPIAEAQKEQGELDALHNAVARGNGAAAAEAANNLAKQQAELLKAAKLEADTAADPARKKRIQDTIAALERALPATQAAAQAYANKPNDEAAQNDLLHAVTLHAEPLAQLEALVKPNTRNEVSAVARLLEAQLARAAQAAHKGDKPALEEALSKVKGAQEALQQIGKAVAASTKSDQRKNEINKAIADLDGLINKVNAVGRAAADAPADKAKQTELDNLVSACKPPIRTIEREVRGEDADAGEKIATAAAKANRIMAKMNPPKGRKIDPRTLLDAARQLSDDLRDLIGSARDEISKTPITSDKARAAFDLERLLSSLDAAGAQGGKAADAPAVAQSLNRVLETINSKAETPAAAPTTFSTALTAVADDIAKATQAKSALDSNDPLLLAMRSIAEEIAKLAAAAARGARQEILLTGNVLAKLINAFCNELKAIAARCKDFRLADRLIRASTALRNQGTQMKILCSVKAAATNKDTPDTDEQIISITRLLSSNLTDSLETVSTIIKTGRLQGK